MLSFALQETRNRSQDPCKIRRSPRQMVGVKLGADAGNRRVLRQGQSPPT
jgi:hypothetical protein